MYMIYQYVNQINNHMYIGLTNNLKRRMNEHYQQSFNSLSLEYRYPLHTAIRKYGIDNFKINILDSDIETIVEAKQREIYWINYYNTYNDRQRYYGGFLKMWHGGTWKHIMPEVFETNPHKSKYTAQDRDNIVQLFHQSNLLIKEFVTTKECYVGYGTLWKMINTPEFYDNK